MSDGLKPVYPSDIIGERITLSIPDNLNIQNIYEGEEYNIDLYSFINNPDNIQVRYQVISGPGYIKDEHYYHISRNILSQGTHKVIIRQYSQINDSESEFDLLVQDKNHDPLINLIDRDMYAGDTLKINLIEYAKDYDVDNLNFILKSNNPELNDSIVNGNTYIQNPDFNLIHPDNELGEQFNITIEMRDKYNYQIVDDTFILTVKYLDSVPTKPENLRPNNSKEINTDLINFYWDKSRSNLENDNIVYDIYLSEDNQEWYPIIKDTGLTSFKYIPEVPLLSNHVYYWYVSQKNSKDININSDIKTFKTQKNISENVYQDILSID